MLLSCALYSRRNVSGILHEEEEKVKSSRSFSLSNYPRLVEKNNDMNFVSVINDGSCGGATFRWKVLQQKGNIEENTNSFALLVPWENHNNVIFPTCDKCLPKAQALVFCRYAALSWPKLFIPELKKKKKEKSLSSFLNSILLLLLFLMVFRIEGSRLPLQKQEFFFGNLISYLSD